MIISFRQTLITKDEWAHNDIDMRDVRKENVQKKHEMKMKITQLGIGGQ